MDWSPLARGGRLLNGEAFTVPCRFESCSIRLTTGPRGEALVCKAGYAGSNPAVVLWKL